MTERVPADQIERTVGIQRHPTIHYGRAVSAEKRVYILHSAECRDSTPDLRDCPYSLALDWGIDDDHWPADLAVPLAIEDGWLTTHPTSPSAQCRGEGRGGAVSERGES